MCLSYLWRAFPGTVYCCMGYVVWAAISTPREALARAGVKYKFLLDPPESSSPGRGPNTIRGERSQAQGMTEASALRLEVLLYGLLFRLPGKQ